MLFLDNVGQNVRANLPKLRRHLPPTGRDLQILQIQFFWHEQFLSERAGLTKKRSADCPHRARYPNGSCIDRDEYLALLTCSSTSRRDLSWPRLLRSVTMTGGFPEDLRDSLRTLEAMRAAAAQ
jgi:hypothetical protein